LGTSTMLKALRGKIAPAAAAQGFDELTISGIRLTGPVGHRPDFTLDLKKYAGAGGVLMQPQERYEAALQRARHLIDGNHGMESVLRCMRSAGLSQI
jgi:hypothetical protein